MKRPLLAVPCLLSLFTAPAHAATDVNLQLSDASFLGEAAGDQAGFAVSEAGDVNGDGFSDFLIGAPYNDEGGVDAGQAYLVLGRVVGWTPDTSLSGVDASFVGEAGGDAAGYSIAGGGDLDGDGYDDIVIAAPNNDAAGSHSGKVYIWFGAPTGWAPDTQLATAPSHLVGEYPDDLAGFCVDLAQDVNGDSLDDLLVGAPWNGDAANEAGKAYLFFGASRAYWPAAMGMETASASFLGTQQGDLAGHSCAGIGDVNSDGLGDIALSAPFYVSNSNVGIAHVIHGKTSGWTTNQALSTSDASFVGEDLGDQAGWALAGGGDFDDDGFHDLLIGAPMNGEFGSDGAGQFYIVRGSQYSWSTYTNLSASDASILPESHTEELGWSLSEAGDHNGDGIADFAVGSPETLAGGTAEGAVRLFLGGAVVWAMDGPAANAHIRFTGEANGDAAGYSIAGIPDANGDGASELLVGAPLSGQSGTDSGKVYLALGEPCVGSDDDGDGWTDCQGDCDDSDATLHGGDTDGDGHTPCAGDCDDSDSAVFPNATEVCDGVPDNDCDGAEVVWDVDHDGDGWTSCEGDCNEADAAIHPEDVDSDGYSPCDGDCDDTRADVSPVAQEICDGLDTDCDESIPSDELDEDGDGISTCAGDCDDGNAEIHPGQEEICDAVDNDCDGVTDDVDADGDGYLPPGCGGEDCDDSASTVNPSASEDCENAVDDDCDGLVDEADPDCDLGDDDDSLSGDDDAHTDDDQQGEDPDPTEDTGGCECGLESPVGNNATVELSLVLLVVLRMLRSRGQRPRR